MYSVLIVDDEPAAIDGLRKGLKWEKCRVDNVYTAASVQRARQIFLEQQVDVLFCDIEMPRESGLVLVEWVRRNYPETVSILLTCHAEFDYIHEAMTCGAFDYLLKPMPYNEVEDVLRRALEHYWQQCEKERYAGYGERWVQHSDLVREQILRDYLISPITRKGDYLAKSLKAHGIEMNTDVCYSLTLCTARYKETFLQSWAPEEFNYVFKNVLCEVFESQCIAVCMQLGEWCILQPVGSQSDDERRTAFEQVMQFAIQHAGCEVCFYTAKPVVIEALCDIYKELMAICRNNVAYGSRVFTLERKAEIPKALPPQIDHWRRLLEEEDFDAFQKAVKEYMAMVVDSGSADAKFLLALYHDVIQLLYAVLAEKGIQASDMLENFTARGRWERVPDTVERMQDFLQEVLAIAAESVTLAAHTSELVNSVERYVKEHISEEIRRDEIARTVYLNPAYLSRVYKEKRGISISDYIIKTRLDFVKKYLRETELSITAIAYQAGFTSLPYLSRRFREETGLTPQEYRKHHLRETYHSLHDNREEP